MGSMIIYPSIRQYTGLPPSAAFQGTASTIQALVSAIERGPSLHLGQTWEPLRQSKTGGSNVQKTIVWMFVWNRDLPALVYICMLDMTIVA